MEISRQKPITKERKFTKIEGAFYALKIHFISYIYKINLRPLLEQLNIPDIKERLNSVCYDLSASVPKVRPSDIYCAEYLG